MTPFHKNIGWSSP